MTNSAFTADPECFKQLFESSPDPSWIIDGNRMVECNEAAVNILGYTSRKEFLDVHPSKLSPPLQPNGENSYAKAERMLAIAREQGINRFEWKHIKADGSSFIAEVTLSSFHFQDRQVIYCVWRDVTERKQAEAALRESEFRWKFAIEGSGDGVWDWNIQTDEVKYSRRWKEMLGYADSDILPTNEEWVSRIHALDQAYVAGAMQAYLDGRTDIYVVEYRLRCKDDSYKWILGRGMVVSRSDDGELLRMIGTHTDITERKQMEEEVRQLAFYDTLTHLPNRRLLSDRLTQAMAASKRSACHCALMFLDLDNFKPLNDTHGHEVGDLLLIEAARRLKACVREMDTVARFGGDEFVIILHDLSADKTLAVEQTLHIAEKIRVSLAAPYCLAIKERGRADSVLEHCCTASIGVILFSNQDASQSHILKMADAAMYQAKDAGRNMIRLNDLQAA